MTVLNASSLKPLLCIGHSHVSCVARAAAIDGVSLRSFNFWDLPEAINRERGHPTFCTSICDALMQHDGPVFSLVGGASHVVMGMLVHPRRFDFVLPQEPDLPLDPTAEILPALAVRRVIESLAQEYLMLMDEVRRLCTGPMYHMEPPPPYRDATRMHADIPWGMFPDRCQEISPAPLRYKLWRMHSQVLAAWCHGAGVGLVAAPPTSMDDSGFMLATYYGDGAHANEAYGSLLLQQMRALA